MCKYVPGTRKIELYLEHLSPKQAALKHKLLMNLYESGTFKKGVILEDIEESRVAISVTKGSGSKLKKGRAKGGADHLEKWLCLLNDIAYNCDDERGAEATEGGQGSGDKVEDGPLNADNEGDENEKGHEAEEVNERAELEANEEDNTTDSEFVDSDYSLEDDDRRAVDDTVVESVIRDAERGEGVENQHLEEVIDARDVIYPEFNEDDPEFEKGLKFRDAAQLRKTVIYNEDSMQVKTYVGKHERLRIWRENPNCKVAWLVKRYVDKFRLNPNMPITAFMKTVKEEIMIEIHLKTAYKVRAQCLKILDGSNVDQYTKLWEYYDELRRTNSGTTVQMKVLPYDDAHVIFQRIYICLGACKNGFKDGCRQLVGLDGCHLKGVFKGHVTACSGNGCK
ncbi:uncharacterized protein LOC125470543 [Pyrus x bretschneideri]|uniref:uncharacterized protein LOC125470543 n=1 Tax=Pyrus x bretschneideri TaxID=225117 RepID=UPI002030F9D1|nr:uncharacterized protein LOC125470543 [Pyrus x bretschneideri]